MRQFLPAADPCRNIHKCFEHTFCPSPLLLGFAWLVGWGPRGADFMGVSGNFVLTSPSHQANIFTPQRMAKSASYAESHFCKRRQSSWPRITLQSQQSTGEVQRHLETSENRRAVQDIARKKQNSHLGSNTFFSTLLPEKCFNAEWIPDMEDNSIGSSLRKRGDIRPSQLNRQSMPEGWKETC